MSENVIEENNHKLYVYPRGESTRGNGEYIPLGDFGDIPEFLMTRVRVKRYRCRRVEEK